MNRKALVLLAVFGLASVPAFAICADAPTFGAVVGQCPSSPDGLCAFVTPVADHVPANLTGYWWNLTTGNPLPATGADNGTWAMTGDPDAGDWMFDLGGGRMVPFGTWASTDKIDGCYSITGGFTESVNIMAVFDQNAGQGYHAAVGVVRTPAFADEWDYSLSEGGAHDGLDKPLVAIPKPSIVASTKVDDLNRQVTLASLSTIGGIYTDSLVPFSAVAKGVKVYRYNVPVGGQAPVDRTRSLWTAVSGTLPFDAVNDTLTLTCTGDTWIYLAYAVVYDSTFESAVVGENSVSVACGPTLADPDQKGKKFRMIDRKAK